MPHCERLLLDEVVPMFMLPLMAPDATSLQWEYAGDGIVRQIMAYDEHLMMVKVKFNQGAIGTLHQHPHTQSTYVASGCFEVAIGQEKKVLRAGDGYYVAPNLL